jgi:hypothetical protein
MMYYYWLIEIGSAGRTSNRVRVTAFDNEWGPLRNCSKCERALSILVLGHFLNYHNTTCT